MLTLAHPGALLLFPAAILLLLVFRLWRSRRITIGVGSLLLWNRLAALPTVPPKKKFTFDAALLWQALALLFLSVALAFPALLPSAPRGREFFILIDNGPLARALQNGRPGLGALLDEARRALARLSSDDRVRLARAAPFPAMLSKEPLGKADAAALLDKISPALSGPDAAGLRAFALDHARTLSPGAALPALVFSFARSARTSADAQAIRWNVPNIQTAFGNVGIVEAGAALNERARAGGRRLLARVKNFSTSSAAGELLLEAEDGARTLLEKQALVIAPNASVAAGFKVPEQSSGALRISWQPAGKPDALPEDDAVIFFPRAVRSPQIRFHSPLPVLERLVANALNAEVRSDETGTLSGEADLDIYVRTVPENIPDSAHAVLFVAPSSGYHGFFDVGPTLLAWPKAERGDNDPLNADIPSGDAGIVIPKALEILQTGDFKVLLRDAVSGRALGFKFIDEKSRACYVLAFEPNEGLAPERLLDPALAALLTRVVAETAHGGAPYTLKKAREYEALSGQPLPADWVPGAAFPAQISGVLDERSSDLRAGAGDEKNLVEATGDLLMPADTVAVTELDFLPWLAVIGGLCAAAELFFRGRK